MCVCKIRCAHKCNWWIVGSNSLNAKFLHWLLETLPSLGLRLFSGLHPTRLCSINSFIGKKCRRETQRTQTQHHFIRGYHMCCWAMASNWHGVAQFVTLAQDYKEKHKLNSKQISDSACEVTSFLSTDCELSTKPCSRFLYSLGPLSNMPMDDNSSWWYFCQLPTHALW